MAPAAMRVACACAYAVVAIVELLEEQLAEREQRERALETALQKAKAAAAPAPPPTPAPAPAPAPPMEPEEVYDAPIHPAASIASLGRHLRDFCDSIGLWRLVWKPTRGANLSDLAVLTWMKCVAKLLEKC